MAVVWIPSLMRDLTRGETRVTVPGTTLRQVIENLEAAYPGFRERICDGDDVSPTIAVAVDGEIARLGMLEPVAEESEIHFLPAVSGGANDDRSADAAAAAGLRKSTYHLLDGFAAEWSEGALTFQAHFGSDGEVRRLRWSSSPDRAWFRDAFVGGERQRRRATSALRVLQMRGTLPQGFRIVFPFRRRGEQVDRLN